jgi:CelD/BcsL family acetyltransferase involved in cellulose biosynthesis
MHVDDEVIATNVCFQVAGRMSYYQSGRDIDHRWRGVGMTLIARAIEHAVAAGCHEVDFLRGREGYKREFASQERQLLRIQAQWGMRGRAASAVLAVARRARRATRAG